VVVQALVAVAPGGTVAINAIHLDAMPAFGYDLLWRERVLRSVANFTRRDATEFLDLAAAIPIQPQVEPFPLDQAPAALEALAAGRIHGSAVLTVDPPAA
jgi:propanol-preferring alcohol dehydrogenase